MKAVPAAARLLPIVVQILRTDIAQAVIPPQGFAKALHATPVIMPLAQHA